MHVHVVEKKRIDKERINAPIFLEVVLAIDNIRVSNLEEKVNASILKYENRPIHFHIDDDRLGGERDSVQMSLRDMGKNCYMTG